MALLGPREMSDLGPQSVPKRTRFGKDIPRQPAPNPSRGRTFSLTNSTRLKNFDYARAAENGGFSFRTSPRPGPSLWATRLAVAGGRKRVALAQQLAAHRQLQQPEAEPSGPLEIVDVMLVLNLGDWGNGPNLLLCSLAASRSARCPKDTAALSRSVGGQDRIVARLRRGGHIRPGLAFFQPRCHSCHCCGQRCGRCRGNH
jgi:hypothetical protein